MPFLASGPPDRSAGEGPGLCRWYLTGSHGSSPFAFVTGRRRIRSAERKITRLEQHPAISEVRCKDLIGFTGDVVAAQFAEFIAERPLIKDRDEKRAIRSEQDRVAEGPLLRIRVEQV